MRHQGETQPRPAQSPRARRQARALARLERVAQVAVSDHARERAVELGFSLDDLLWCVARPEQSYPCAGVEGRGRRINQRGDLAVVVDEPSHRVVTVLLRTPELWVHGRDTRGGHATAGS